MEKDRREYTCTDSMTTEFVPSAPQSIFWQIGNMLSECSLTNNKPQFLKACLLEYCYIQKKKRVVNKKAYLVNCTAD